VRFWLAQVTAEVPVRPCTCITWIHIYIHTNIHTYISTTKSFARSGTGRTSSDPSVMGGKNNNTRVGTAANTGATMQNIFDKSTNKLTGNETNPKITNKSSSKTTKRVKRFSHLVSATLRFFGTRLALSMLFLGDLFSSLYVCTFTSIPTEGGPALTNLEITYIVGNIAIFGVYVAQFVFQVCLPKSMYLVSMLCYITESKPSSNQMIANKCQTRMTNSNTKPTDYLSRPSIG
jgi:hypothetical protein